MLLASTLFILVSILGIVLYYGAGIRADRERIASEHRESLRNSMRWQQDDDSEPESVVASEGFVDSVRRRSVSLVSGVQREIGSFERRDACSQGFRRLSSDLSALLSPASDRHNDVELLLDKPESTEASAREMEGPPGTRRRSSRVVFLDVLADAETEGR
ncbi:hypothetical protein VDGL01_07343 [Verticillium dahliae]